MAKPKDQPGKKSNDKGQNQPSSQNKQQNQPAPTIKPAAAPKIAGPKPTIAPAGQAQLYGGNQPVQNYAPVAPSGQAALYSGQGQPPFQGAGILPGAPGPTGKGYGGGAKPLPGGEMGRPTLPIPPAAVGTTTYNDWTGDAFQLAGQALGRVNPRVGQQVRALQDRYTGLAGLYKPPGGPTEKNIPLQTTTGEFSQDRQNLASASRYSGWAFAYGKPPTTMTTRIAKELPFKGAGFSSAEDFLKAWGYAEDPNQPGVWGLRQPGKVTVTGAGGDGGGYGDGGSGGYDYGGGGWDSGWNDWGGGGGGYNRQALDAGLGMFNWRISA